MTARNVHVLPCGPSILGNLKERKVGGEQFATAVPVLTDWAEVELARAEPARAWRDSFHRVAIPYIERLRRFQQPWLLSAEVAGLHQHATRHAPLEPDDMVVLLASDTAHGMLAALLNAVQLARPVRVQARPASDSYADGEPVIDAGSVGGDRANPVHVIRIPGLLPDTTNRFTAAMQDVARAMVWSGRQAQREEMTLHLAGGYKATLPYLVVLAEYLKDICPPVRAFCLHDGDTAAGRVPEPVEIFLRRVNAEADHRALAAAARHHVPDDEGLRDFAYTDHGSRVELTPIGQILWDLLKVARRPRP